MSSLSADRTIESHGFTRGILYNQYDPDNPDWLQKRNEVAFSSNPSTLTLQMSLHDDLLKMTELVRGDGFWKNSDEDDTTSGDYIKAARSLGIALNFLAQTHNWM